MKLANASFKHDEHVGLGEHARIERDADVEPVTVPGAGDVDGASDAGAERVARLDVCSADLSRPMPSGHGCGRKVNRVSLGVQPGDEQS